MCWQDNREKKDSPCWHRAFRLTERQKEKKLVNKGTRISGKSYADNKTDRRGGERLGY